MALAIRKHVASVTLITARERGNAESHITNQSPFGHFETSLILVPSVTQSAEFSKAFFTLKMSCCFFGTHASVTSHTAATAGCHQAHRRRTALHAGFRINRTVSVGTPAAGLSLRPCYRQLPVHS